MVWREPRKPEIRKCGELFRGDKLCVLIGAVAESASNPRLSARNQLYDKESIVIVKYIRFEKGGLDGKFAGGALEGCLQRDKTARASANDSDPDSLRHSRQSIGLFRQPISAFQWAYQEFRSCLFCGDSHRVFE